MTKHLFIVSSAINTKFGDYDTDQRLLQTFKTIKSVYDYAPDSKIAVFESSGIPLPQEIIQPLSGICHFLLDMSQNPVLAKIHNHTSNWDVVKNVCEILSFNLAFPTLEQNKMLEGVDRIHKLSGRYFLNENFDLSVYDKYPDKIIISQPRPSKDGKKIGIPFQYSSRLWSWPTKLHPTVTDFYIKAITEMRTSLEKSLYMDLEHLMFKLLPKELIHEVPTVGIEGFVASNSEFIKE